MDDKSLDDLLTERRVKTSPARASDIADMRSIGLAEFIEITEVGEGSLGIYQINVDGITIRLPKLSDLEPVDQNAILQAQKKLSLRFPCSPTDLKKWHDATRGEIGKNESGKDERASSDFPLHRGFIDQINSNLGHPPSKIKNAVSADKIKDAFAGIPTGTDRKWWDLRVRDPSNYGLSDARVAKGKGGRGNPSLWDPVAIAAWVIEKHPELKNKVIHACKNHFPDHDTDFLA